MLKRLVVIILCALTLSSSYLLGTPSYQRRYSRAIQATSENADQTELIRSIIDQKKVVLFMKGEKDEPKW